MAEYPHERKCRFGISLNNLDYLTVKIIKVNLDYRDFWGETNLR
jgi:hypothetical protein